MRTTPDSHTLTSSMIAGCVLLVIALLIGWLAAQPVTAAETPVITAFAVRWEPLPVIDEVEIFTLELDAEPMSVEETPAQP